MPLSKAIISRTRFAKDIVCEFSKPVKKSNKAIILIPGLPSMPAKPEVIKYFTSKGYWCFLPRLRGTWESGGKFLEFSPEEDYGLVIDGIKKGFADLMSGENVICKIKRIDIVGGSFGGTAAVLLSRRKDVYKAIAFAPVIDWNTEGVAEPHNKFVAHLTNAYGDAYRGSKKRVEQMLKGDFYNPIEQTGFDKKKLLIIQSFDDEVVPAEPAVKFCKDNKIQLKLFRTGGHFGLSSSIKGKNRKIVNEFLNIKG